MIFGTVGPIYKIVSCKLSSGHALLACLAIVWEKLMVDVSLAETRHTMENFV